MIPGVSIHWALLLMCCQQSYTVACFKSFVPTLFQQRAWYVLGKSSLLFSSVLCEFEQESFRCGYNIAGINPFSLAYTETCLSIRYWHRTHAHRPFYQLLLSCIKCFCSSRQYCKMSVGKEPGSSSFQYFQTLEIQ